MLYRAVYNIEKSTGEDYWEEGNVTYKSELGTDDLVKEHFSVLQSRIKIARQSTKSLEENGSGSNDRKTSLEVDPP